MDLSIFHEYHSVYPISFAQISCLFRICATLMPFTFFSSFLGIFFRSRRPDGGVLLGTTTTTTTVASAVVVMTTFFRNVPGLVRDVTRRRRRRRPTSSRRPPSLVVEGFSSSHRGGFRWRHRVRSTNMAIWLRRIPGSYDSRLSASNVFFGASVPSRQLPSIDRQRRRFCGIRVRGTAVLPFAPLLLSAMCSHIYWKVTLGIFEPNNRSENRRREGRGFVPFYFTWCVAFEINGDRFIDAIPRVKPRDTDSAPFKFLRAIIANIVRYKHRDSKF